MNLKHISIVAALLTVLAIVYGSLQRRKTIDGSDDKVIHVEENDLEMKDAIAKAKIEFPFFVNNWKTMKNDGYSLKFWIPTDNGDTEHIWFNPIQIKGDIIKAKCANDPEKVSGLKEGDTRELNTKHLSDWMIVVGKKCYGGYTIRVLAKRDPSKKPPFEFAEIQ